MKDEQLSNKMGDQEESEDGKFRTMMTFPTKTTVEFNPYCCTVHIVELFN